MTVQRAVVGPAVLGIAIVAAAGSASAQPVGTFRWQLQPYCNVVSLAVTQVGGQFRLEGADDACGAATTASAIGTASFNPNGTIGLGFSIVTGPNGAPVHVYATVTLPSASGTWVDSSGNGGAFALGAATGGAPRPVVGPARFGAVFVQPPSPTGDVGLSAWVQTDLGPITSNAAAFYGQFGAYSGVGSPGAAGVRGDSANAMGVVGSTDIGWGVRGVAINGTGVEGVSGDGIGVRASTSTGTVALDVDNGAIAVSGPARTAFVHTSAAGNIVAAATCIDHPLANHQPNALLFVTYTHGLQSSIGPYVNKPHGVYYANGSTGLPGALASNVWCILNEDASAMAAGLKFNVLVIWQF